MRPCWRRCNRLRARRRESRPNALHPVALDETRSRPSPASSNRGRSAMAARMDRPSLRCRLGAPGWQGNREGGALTERALDVDAAPVTDEDLLANPKAQPEAAVVRGGNGALETPENAYLVRGCDADATILHGQTSLVGRLGDPHIDRLSCTVLGRVHHQV